jgi:hypothetical protein
MVEGYMAPQTQATGCILCSFLKWIEVFSGKAKPKVSYIFCKLQLFFVEILPHLIISWVAHFLLTQLPLYVVPLC